MTRLLLPLALTLLGTGAAAAQPPAAVTIRWHGQSFFEIESSKGTKIVTDPHAIEAFGRKAVLADVVLTSHFHNDHTQVQVVQNLARARRLDGLKRGPRRDEWNVVDETFKDVRLRVVGTYHDAVQGLGRGKNAVWVLDVDGLTVAHLGDLGHKLSDETLKRIGPVDVLLIPVGGVYTLNGYEAQEVVAQVKPRRYVIPMHCGVTGYEDLLPVKYFLEDQPRVKRFPGNKLTVEAGAPPAQPTIAVLNWK